MTTTFGERGQKDPHLCGSCGLRCRLCVRRAGPLRVRRFLEPCLCDTMRRSRCDLQFLRQHQRWSCYASETGQVQRLCRGVGGGSRFGDRSKQTCYVLGKAVGRFRSADLEWPFRKRTLLRLLDRAAKLTSALYSSDGTQAIASCARSTSVECGSMGHRDP